MVDVVQDDPLQRPAADQKDESMSEVVEESGQLADYVPESEFDFLSSPLLKEQDEEAALIAKCTSLLSWSDQQDNVTLQDYY